MRLSLIRNKPATGGSW